jgi:hypothetical protein
MSGGRALQAGDWIASYRIEAISVRARLGPELIQALEAVLAQPKVKAAHLRRPAHVAVVGKLTLTKCAPHVQLTPQHID